MRLILILFFSYSIWDRMLNGDLLVRILSMIPWLIALMVPAIMARRITDVGKSQFCERPKKANIERGTIFSLLGDTCSTVQGFCGCSLKFDFFLTQCTLIHRTFLSSDAVVTNSWYEINCNTCTYVGPKVKAWQMSSRSEGAVSQQFLKLIQNKNKIVKVTKNYLFST